MMTWDTDPAGSFYNYLSKGCQICRIGAGLVLFVTGLCERSCFYCPLSEERKSRDVSFADEQQVRSIQDILDEARSIGALGTGITGGEPLLKMDFVLECIRALKAELGPEHHIHLYTGLLPSGQVLRRLKEAGLDEIRFHPPIEGWSDASDLKKALMEAKSLGLTAGVEIPAIKPAPEIVEAVKSCEAFLNLNELEFSDTNCDRLKDMGFKPEEIHCGAAGSEEMAREHFMDPELKVHYCPSRFKDCVQLRERLKRRAERVARPFDIPTEDGTLIYGTISGDLSLAISALSDLGVPKEMFSCDGDDIEISAAILEEISKELKSIGLNISLVERYPLEDGLVVERIPL